MTVKLDGIHFLVTYRCTYACDHCFVWGSPDATATMSLGQLTAATPERMLAQSLEALRRSERREWVPVGTGVALSKHVPEP